MKARLTTDHKFLHIYEYEEMEIEQVRYTFKKRIQNWRFHPLVKKKNMGWNYRIHRQVQPNTCRFME